MTNPHAGKALWLELGGGRSIFLPCPTPETFAEVAKLDPPQGAPDSDLARITRAMTQLEMILGTARWSSSPVSAVEEMAPLTAIEAAALTLSETRGIFHVWAAQATGTDPQEAFTLQAILAHSGGTHPWDHWTLGDIQRALAAGETP